MNPFQKNFLNNRNRNIFQNNIGKSVLFSSIKNQLILDKKFFLNINDLFENKDSSITFFFLLMTGHKFEIKAKANDTFKNVFDKFLIEQCPSDLKDKIGQALFNGGKVDYNKTLSENKITEGSKVVIVTAIPNDLDLDQYSYNALMNEPAARSLLTDSKINQNSSLVLDIEDKKLLMDLYEHLKKCQKLLKKINQNVNQNVNQKKNKYSCKTNKSECSHIHLDKHEHGLVLCYTNRNWICNICRKHYSKDESTYFCSLCDFDVCNCCIGIAKKYPLKQ